MRECLKCHSDLVDLTGGGQLKTRVTQVMQCLGMTKLAPIERNRKISIDPLKNEVVVEFWVTRYL